MATQIWKPSSQESKFGVAIYNFYAANILHGLSLRIGQTVQITEECGEWFRGRLMQNALEKGIFPKNCIQSKEAILNNPGPYEIVTPVLEPVVDELTTVLREWGNILKDLFLERKAALFLLLKETTNELLQYRREIVFGKLTKDQQSDIREKVTLKIDIINRKLHLDLVPRVDGQMISADDTSVVELFQIHLASSERTTPKRSSSLRNAPNNGFKTLTKFTTVRRQGQQPIKGLTTHHFFMTFKSFMCNIGDASTLLFALYDVKTATYISEKFMVKLTKHGMPVDIELLGKQFGIFTDLTSADLIKSLYLVCKIFRQGKLVADSKKPANAEYRRPFGTGVKDLSKVLSGEHGEETELYIQIFNSNEIDFHNLEELLINNKQSGKISTFGSNSYSVCVGVKLFHGDAEKIIKEKGNCALVPRLGFPEVILPGYVRNDFYVTLCKAEFEKGSKSSGKNIEVALCAVSEKGQVFNDCMYLGSGDRPVSEYRSHVLYHTNSPQWNETLKISLPIEQFHTAHLRFTFSHCSRNEGKVKGEKIFGFSFIKLLNTNGTVILDTNYNLFIYKLDNSVNFMSVQSYLRLPHNSEELARQQEKGVVFAGPNRNQKESLFIKTFLCSTKLTQNSDIVHLLRWRKMKQDEVLLALESLLKVSPEEVVKFLQDVFDALFNILSENQDNFSLPVFKALVSITKIVEELKYQHFKSTLNTYVEEHFSSTIAYKCLISSFSHVVTHAKDSKLKGTLKDAMQSLAYIFKVIVRSYQLHNSANNSPEVLSQFHDSLRGLFQDICGMMELNNDSLNDSKLEVLKKLPSLCNDGLAVFSEEDFSNLVASVICAVPKVAASLLQAQKISCLREIVDTNLFINPGARRKLMPLTLQTLCYQMERKLELLLCLDLLGDIIIAIQHLEDVSEDINLLSSSTLSILLNVILTIDRRSQRMTGLAVSCLLGILKLMHEEHYDSYLEIYENKMDLRDFMKKLTVAFKELLTMDIYPKDWFVLKTLGSNVILTAVQYFSKAFTEYFLEEQYFDQQLWQNYFQLAVIFLTQSSLHLETFLTSKREKILSKYGDMRLIMGFEIKAMWEVLGDKKKYFIPGLIGSFLEMTLVPEQELRKATISLFYDMMKVEFAETHSFKKVECELLEQLELLMNNNKGDLEFQQLFHQIMTRELSNCRDPQLHELGLKSVHSITELLKRLLDYRVATNDDCNLDQKTMCTVRLLEFYKDLGRQNMYIKCIYKLVELHVLCNNYTEAAFTLQLHASLLEWSDNELPAFLNFPKQTEWQRKEQLYLDIIKYFDDGKTWENGIKLCKELANLYENKIVDYTKLSDILRKQAYFYDNIMKQMRPPVNYFRVSFYGRGFPHYLKDQVLIYRGLELETLAGFTSRIRVEFPGAEIMYKNTPPEASIVQGIGQHIQICNVNPISSEAGLFEVKTIDEKISCYYRTNEVNQFVFSRPFHKGEKDKNNEFKTLWLERTMHWTKRSLPDILKWSTIDSTRKIELTPIENAIESILSKNSELIAMVNEYKGNSNLNLNRLSMILNGVIDANVNGGIANYQSAFLSEEYTFLNPDDSEKVKQLKYLLQKQSSVLQEGLEVHESYVTENLRPFHDKMVMMYSAMKTSIETGQPMENVLARPSSLTMNSTWAGRSSPKKDSPKGSPLEGRRGAKTPSDGDVATVNKREKAGISISTSLQNMFRRSSVQLDSPSSENKRVPPPLPPRRTSVPSVSSDGDAQSSGTDLPASVPTAAMKRLGIQANLTASAPSLAFIQEEDTPALPPRNQPKKRHTQEETQSMFFQDLVESLQGNTDDVLSRNDLQHNEPPNNPYETLSRMQKNFRDSTASKTSVDSVFSTASDTKDSQGNSSETESSRNSVGSTPSGFQPPTPADLENAMLYDNIPNNNVDEEDFYDSPKELIPQLHYGHEPPPLPLPRKGSKTEEVRPKPPTRRRKPSVNDTLANNDEEGDSPPPLPVKSSNR